MKRFTMKRITALVLALIMTLSLLPMTAWAETGTLLCNSVEFYLLDENNAAITDGITVKESVLVNFESGKGVTLYMKPTVAGETLKVTGGNLALGEVLNTSKAVFTEPGTETGYYTLTLTTAVTENCSAYVQRFNGENPVQNGGIDIQFFAQSSSSTGESGGNDDEFLAVFDTEYTLVKIRNIEGQSNVLSFEKTENGKGDPTIVATIKTDDPEAWRTVLTREDGLGLRFEIAAKEGAPNVRIHSAEGEANTLAQYIEEWSANTSFLPYDDPHERNRGGEYATAVYDEENGVTSILPITSALTFGCSWQYGENDVRTDGFVLKIVIADNELDFPVAVPDAAFVTTDRITAIAHTELDTLIQLKMSGSNVVCENGKVTYASAYPINAANYAAFTAAVDTAVEDDGIGENGDGKPMYNLLRVATPNADYVAKSYKGRFTALREYSDNSPAAMDLEYMWNGFGCEQVYTLTWKHKTDATEPDIVEKLTIVSPSNPDLKWMDMIGQRIPDNEGRVTFTVLPEDCGAEISYSNGTITTTFDNNAVLDVEPILESVVTVTVPVLDDGRKAVAVRYAGEVGIMGDPADPTLTEFTATLIDRFKGAVDSGNEVNIQELGRDTVFVPLTPLAEQTYGENGEIKYFYSTHDGNRFLMLKWFFPDDSNSETPDVLYEYMEVEATPYLCKWEEELKADSEVTEEVEKPTAINDSLANSNIKLVARIHPQKQEDGYGQYFFELDMVAEGEGNVYTDPNGETYFTIILPYSFMGDDWNYEKAKNLKEKPMITHFDKEYKQLAGNKGTITGEYTERGIEFQVNSFSPFTVSWSAPTSKTYATKYGSSDPNNPVSTLTVELTELQAKVLTLPNEINDKNELIIKVHNAAQNNEDVWRKLMEEDDFGVHYYFNSVEEEGTAKPVVKSIGTDVTIEEAIDRMADARFVDYNAPAGRDNGLDFAWATKETDRLFIIPTANSMTSAVVWRYANGDGSYTDKEDGVIIKFVLDNDISNAVVIETEQISVVDSARVTVKNHDNLGNVFAGTYSGANGVLTYRYTGPATGAATDNTTAGSAIATAAKADNFVWATGENPSYPVLTVRAPDGYTLQTVACSECSDTIGSAGATSVDLAYHWLGLGEEQTYTLTWVDANSADSIVEQLTIETPAVAGATWMSHINETAGEEFSATPVPNANVRITQQGMDKTGIEVSYSNGLLWSEFKQDVMLDVDAVNGTTFSIKIPENAVAYKVTRCGDGSDNCTYTNNNTWMPADFQDMVDREPRIDLEGNETYIPEQGVRALLKQSIGNIQYYYSADRGTYLVLVKWIYDKNDENNGAKYEYIQYDTSPYYCRWKTSAVSPDDPSNSGENTTVVPVEKPTVAFDGNINLVTRIHPQNTHGQFFYELDVVDGDGNAYTETAEDGFLIILPYAFMGTDPNGQPWTKETAIASGKKAMITHYDDDFTVKKNNGTIEGEFTDRGIEFWVDSFSPFLLNWDGQSGGQQPEGGGNDVMSSYGVEIFTNYHSEYGICYDRPDWGGVLGSEGVFTVSSTPNKADVLYLISENELSKPTDLDTTNGDGWEKLTGVLNGNDNRHVYKMTVKAQSGGTRTVNVPVNDSDTLTFTFRFDAFCFLGGEFYTKRSGDAETGYTLGYNGPAAFDDLYVYYDEQDDNMMLCLPYERGAAATVYVKVPSVITDMKIEGGNLQGIATITKGADREGNNYFAITLPEGNENGGVVFLQSYRSDGQAGNFLLHFEPYGGGSSNRPIGLQGVDIFTYFGSEFGLGYQMPEFDGISVNETENTVYIPCRPNQERRLYLLTGQSLTKDDSGLATMSVVNYGEQSVYTLIMPGQRSGSYPVTVNVGEDTTITFIFAFEGVYSSGVNYFTTFGKNNTPTFLNTWSCDNLQSYCNFVTDSSGVQHPVFILNAPFTTGQGMTLYLRPVRGDIASMAVTGGSLYDSEQKNTTINLYDFVPLNNTTDETYKLTLTNAVVENGSLYVTYYDENNNPVGGTDIQFQMRQNGTCWRTFETTYGSTTDEATSPYSKFTVRFTPLQAQFIDMDYSNNVLTLTVNNTSDEIWRTLVNEDGGLNVWFSFDSIEAEGTAKPMVKAISSDGSISDLVGRLSGESYKFSEYGDDSMGNRSNGIDFAWATVGTGRTVVIPTEKGPLSYAWIWRYENADGTYTDKADGITVKVVLADDIKEAIVLDDVKENVPAAGRVTFNPNFNKLKEVFAADTYDSATGVWMHEYKGSMPESGNINDWVDSVVEEAATSDGFDPQNSNGYLMYPLLVVAPPYEGYIPVRVDSQYANNNRFDDGVMRIPYLWRGVGTETIYTLVWDDGNGNLYTEKLTVKVPNIAGSETWMDRLFDGAMDPVPNGNVIVDLLDDALETPKYGASNSYENGLLYTEFDSKVMLAADAILGTKIWVKAPTKTTEAGDIIPVVAYQLGGRSIGNQDDPTYNSQYDRMIDQCEQDLNAQSVMNLQGDRILLGDLSALLPQTIGDIQYYYSADRGTRVSFIKWIFEDNTVKYEYLRRDTDRYYCEWVTDVTTAVSGAVQQPTAEAELSNLKLVSRIHPQNMSGHFFFELEVVDDMGNVYTETNEDGFTIILPYSFMGTDSNGQPWTKATASQMKTPMITHFADDFTVKENKGTIKGTFTDRGIEFVVDSFSPFLLTCYDAAEEPVVTVSDDLTIAYGYEAKQISVTVAESDDYTYAYQWYDANQQPVSGATADTYTIPAGLTVGEYSYYCVVTATRIDSGEDVTTTTSSSIKVSVEKAEPTYTIPVDLSATYGETLADVTLPDGWSWKDSTTSVGNVGNNTFKAIFTPTDTNNYTTAEADVTVTVNAKQLANPTLTLDVSSFTYDGTEKKPVVTVTDGTTKLTKDTDYTVTYSDNTNAGTGKVTVTFKGNYSGSAEETFAIGKVQLAKPTATKTDFTYTGTEQKYLVGNNLYTIANNTRTDAGSQTVTVVLNDKVNYAWADGSTTDLTFTFTIAPKTVSAPVITLTGDSFTYTGAAITPNVVSVKDGDTEIPATEYTVSYSANTNVGTATVTITDVAVGNYTVSGSKTFAITKADASCTAPVAAADLIYSGDAQALVSAGTAAGGTMQYSLSESGEFSATIPTAKDAGTYTVYYKVVGDANHKDTAVLGSVEVTIDPKAVTVTADDKTKTYGDTDPTLTYTAEGLVTGETLSDITLSRAAGETVGSYAITATQSENANKNYVITFVNGTLMVEQKEIGIEWSNTELTYNGEAQKPTATATGVVNGDVVTLTVDGAQTNASAEAYTATVTAVSNDNYKLPEVVTTQFTISKAQPSYTNPVGLTATYGQTLADVELPAGWAWVDAVQSVGNVGNNNFAVKFTPEDSTNYNTVSGTATVTVAKQQVTKPALDATEFVYTGTEQTYTVVESDLYTVSNNTRKDAGSQKVKIALADKANYAWVGGNSDDLEYTFTIAKAPLTITANAKAITYGDAPANAGVSYTDFVNGETEAVLNGTLSYSYNYEQYGNVGEYVITPTGLTSDNYEITFVNGTLTVGQKEIGIEWSNTELTYNGEAQKPTATATGVVNGDVVTLTVSGEQTNASADAYTATVTAVSNGNYKLPEVVTTQFTISKAEQAAPVVSKTDETVYGKDDGTITGVDATMEYRKDGEATYTAILGDKVENLSDGKYFVRYKEDANRNASPDAEVTIATGKVIYYPVVTPETKPVETPTETKPTETKPTTPAQPVTPAVEEVTVPVSGEENTIHADASVSGTTATIDKVDTTHLNEIIGDHVETGTVTIDFSDLDSTEPIDTVEIPADVVKEIADAVSDPANDAESLEIVLSDGMSIEFDATALANKAAQADGLDITISIKHTVVEILSAAQQQTVGDRVAFDINVTSGGEHITDMGGKVTIHAPYELRDGESAEGIVVYYVDDAGNREKCKTSYDSAKKRVNWETTHFSVYMIDYEAPVADDVIVDDAPADDAEQTGSGAGLWIGIGIVALAAIVVVLAVMAARKKRK